MRGGRRSTSFKPGNTIGKKGGRPRKPADQTAKAIHKAAIADVKEAAKAETGDAIKTLKTIMTDTGKPAAARVAAATAILDRGWGKPQQTIEANVSFIDQLGDSDKSALLAALTAIQEVDGESPTGLPN